ncbi:MAG: branched-chain amino acid ABC transporter permease [Thermodesulfobacteriota bacterium]|nr:branched-chain amino acid ABC transporter permease [Thermodesulfobacteriota bacterium]
MWRPSGIFSVTYRKEIAFIQTPFQWVMLFLALLFGFSLPFYASLEILDFFIKAWITVTAVLGLTLLTGNCGQISLGHTGFMAVGAFAGAISLAKGIPLPFVIIISGLAGGAAGMIFGLPALRIKGFYLAFATLAAYYIIQFALIHYFGGEVGHSVPPPTVLGFTFDSDLRIYYLIATTCFIMTYAAKNITRCKWGRAFVAIRDHDIAANTLGVNVYFYKLMAFFIGCFYAGVAGLLLTVYMGWASVDHYSLSNCIWYLGMIIVGGMNSISGAYMGAFFILGIEEAGNIIAPTLAEIFPKLAGSMIGAIPILFVGLALMIFIMLEPRGLVHRWEIMKTSVRIFPFHH